LGNLLIVRTDYVKNMCIMLDRKLHSHRHVDYLYPQALKHLITYIFLRTI
jgi:hypothetical protein